MATLKPTAPLLASNKGPLKPASPLCPKTAPKTPILHPQRRWRFHLHTGTSEQRRSRFQATGPPDRQGLAGRRADALATRQHARPHWCGGRRRDGKAWLRCPWAVAGPGRASSRRAERSSRRGRLAGGPPPTGTQSSPARQGAPAPETPVGPQAPRPGTQQRARSAAAPRAPHVCQLLTG